MRKFYFLFFFATFICVNVFATTFLISVAVTPATCGNGGTITIAPAGGVGPYMYSIDGGAYQPSNVFTGMPVGLHVVIAMDSNGDTGTQTVTVVVGPALTATFVSTPASCSGADGSITVTVTSGTPVYSFSFDGGITFQPSNIFNNLAAGNYIITIADAAGCVMQLTASVLFTNNITANAGTDTLICAGTSTQLNGSGGSVYSWTPSTGLSNPGIADPVASPLTTTTYLLTVSNGTCSSTDAVVVFVSHPIANAGNDTTICLGSSIQLIGTGGIIYLWTPGNLASNNPTISPIITTEYYLTVADAAGCIAIDSIKVSVQSLAVPLISVSVGTLTVTNPDVSATYTWQVLNGSLWEDIVPAANGISYTATATGEYRVKAESGPCTEFSGSMMAGRMASGNEFGIYLYPNPTAGQLILDEMKLAQGWEIVDIINSEGMKVISQNIQNRTSVSVNVSTLRAGIYTAKLRSSDGRSTLFRFVKQ